MSDQTPKFLRVVLESPFAGEIGLNTFYARQCLLHSLKLGEAPIASHLLHTQVLDDKDPAQRLIGINAGHAWIAKADALVVYADYGISRGMHRAIHAADAYDIPVIMRRLYTPAANGGME